MNQTKTITLDNKIEISRVTFFFALLLTVHTAMLIVSDMAGVKVVQLPFGLTAIATFITYSLSFLVLNIIRELFGVSLARFTVNVGFCTMLLITAFIQIAIWWPGASFWAGQEAYVKVLGRVWRFVGAGYLSYLIFQHVEVTVYGWMNRFTGGAKLWLKSSVSSLVAHILDTTAFITIAFWGLVPSVPKMIAGQFSIKLFIVVATIPVLYLVVNYVRPRIQNPLILGRDDV